MKQSIERNVERIPESGCWIWTKSLRGKGYGQFTHPDRRQEGAHRVSYRAYKGEIPDGMHVCHRCDVPACVRDDGVLQRQIADMYGVSQVRISQILRRRA